MCYCVVLLCLGDPIEVGAAVSVLQPTGSNKPLLLTGLKSELGHSEPAAGVMGLLRLAAQVRGCSLPTGCRVSQYT